MNTAGIDRRRLTDHLAICAELSEQSGQTAITAAFRNLAEEIRNGQFDYEGDNNEWKEEGTCPCKI